MEDIPEDLWSPYKQMYGTLKNIMNNPTDGNKMKFHLCLKNLKPYFMKFLRNPPKNEFKRAILLQSSGLSIDLIKEAIILSDMFDLDELISLELLRSALKQRVYHAGLPHGLVAILLYYDGRRALSWTLRDLFEVTAGISWSAELPTELIETISTFTQYLVEKSNILERLIELLEEFNMSREWELLSINRALGSKRQQTQVWNLLKDIQLAIATSLFNWSAQRGLHKEVQIHLMEFLLTYKTSLPNGNIDNVGLTILMSVLYSFDTRVLLRQSDNSAYVQGLPLLSDPSLLETIYQKLSMLTMPSHQCECNHYASFMVFCFGLSLACVRYLPPDLQIHFSNISNVGNRDEILVGKAMEKMNIFDFIHHDLLENELLYVNEFFFRRMHAVFIDFLDYMHPKVKELRDLAVEEALSAEKCVKSNQSTPLKSFDNSYELLMLCIGKFYKGNPCKLSLCDEYWSLIPDTLKNSRRLSTIYLFIHNNGKWQPRMLFPQYVRMLVGLTSSELSASHVFDLLKDPENPLDARLNWDHFFTTIHSYYNNLRQDRNEASCCNRTPRFKISPREIDALHAIMSLIRNVTLHKEASRIEFTETKNWTAIPLLVGLLSCPLTVFLKAEILFTLNNLVHSEEIAANVWTCLEESQVIETIHMPKNSLNLDFNDEIEQNECRYESYPLSRGILALLNTLINTCMPPDLGIESRQCGILPYVIFVVKSIFLKFYYRTYNKETEKWEIGTECLKILYYLLNTYIPEAQTSSSSPGYHLMVEMNFKSNILHTILILVGDVCKILDDYSKFPGKQHVENCGLYCLLILEQVLLKQYVFFEVQSKANDSELLIGLNRMLLELNPHTNQPDFIMNIMRFVIYNSWLPRHTLASINILHSVVCLPNASEDIFNLCFRPPKLYDNFKLEFRLGFVECLEATPGADADNGENDLSDTNMDSTTNSISFSENVKIRNLPIALEIKESILQLFQRCIMQPMPNVGYFLLGYNVQRDTYRNQPYQNIVVIEDEMNCMTILIANMDKFWNTQKNNSSADDDIEYISERCWYLFHNLCMNHTTAKTTIRHFRNNCNDILMRQFTGLLAYKKETYSVHVVKLMSHVLKCITVEFIMAATDNEICRYDEILHILLSSIEIPHSLTSNKPIKIIDCPSRTTSSSLNQTESGECMHICLLLNFIILNDNENINIPTFQYIDNDKLSEIINNCLTKDKETQFTLINTTKLSDVLHKEINISQKSIKNERHLVLHERKRIMTLADQLNNRKIKQSTTVNLMKAWNRLIQILFIYAPDAAMPLRFRKHYMIKILESLLRKLIKMQFNDRILTHTSESMVLVLSYIRLYSSDQQLDCDSKKESVAPCVINSVLPIRSLLKNVISWIMMANMTAPVLCINLFTIFLQCLCIAMDSNNVVQSDLCFGIDQTDFVMKQLNPFSTKLIEILWFNANYGLEINQVLAFTCLNLILHIKPIPNLVDCFTNRGYIREIVSSLINTDTILMNCLAEVSKNMKEIYVYESKLAFLMCYANSRDGAEILVNANFFLALSKMKVFNMHPNIKKTILHPETFTDVNGVNENNDEFDDRYHTILMSTLDTLDGILTTLKNENHLASTQIFNFLFAHDDFEFVLRTATPYIRLATLKELSALTNIIARAAASSSIDDSEENFLQDYTKVGNTDIKMLNKRKLMNEETIIIDCNNVYDKYDDEKYDDANGGNNAGGSGGVGEGVFARVWRILTGLVDYVLQINCNDNSLKSIAITNNDDGIPNNYDDADNDISDNSDDDGNDDEDEESDYDKESEVHVLISEKIQRNHLERMQHLMLSLFERFAINETTFHKLLKPTKAVFDPTEGNKNLRIKYFLEITMNITLYCRNIITCRRRTIRTDIILSFNDYDVKLMEGISSGSHTFSGVIKTLLNQVKGSVDFHLKIKSTVNHIYKQICAYKVEDQDKERLGKLKKLYEEKREFQRNIVKLIEQNLYLIWLYLDYHIHVPALCACAICDKRGSDNNGIGHDDIDNNGSDISDTSNNPKIIPPDEFDAVTQTLLDTFNKTFCAELLSITEDAKDSPEFVKVCMGLIMGLIEDYD